ncbi:MAG: glycoside hydrolase family 20 zincin-like fold domain-containing protein [Cellulosilyticaceae bacterium]
MYFIPSPKHLTLKEGQFVIKRNTQIILDEACSFEDLEAALELQKAVEEKLGFKLPIHKKLEGDHVGISLKKGALSKEAYTLTITDQGIRIVGGSTTGIFYGIQTLIQAMRQQGAILTQLEIEDEPHFANRGFYHDATRGKVPTLETLKVLVDRAAHYKINQLQLYVEHTFAFEGMSEVWMDKDPLTAEEILVLDAYCQKKHVELVPSLSTFGHLYEVLRTKTYGHLCELENTQDDAYSFVGRMAHHTLNPLDVGSIALVKEMLEQFIPLFSSKQFNICCDETFDLGKGQSKEEKERIGMGKLYTNFLNQVIAIVKSHGRQVMFWGDIILHHPELLEEIPEDVICLTWDYCGQPGEGGIATIAATGKPQYVCPGVGGWSMLMNLMGNAFSNIKHMVNHGVKHGAVGMLNTDWGDYGHINLLGSSMPGMIYGGALSWNPESGEKAFTEMFEEISLVEYGDQTKTLVALLHKLSGHQALGWGDLVRYKELGEYAEREADQLVRGYEAACEVEEKLMALAGTIRYPFDMEEFLVSARAIQLVHCFYMGRLDEAPLEINLVQDSYALAEAFELWFYDYEEIWRKRNKESELRRLREVVQFICKDLRQ